MRRGQAVIEYVLLIALLIMVALFGINTVMRPRLERTMNITGTAMDTANDRLNAALQ